MGNHWNSICEKWKGRCLMEISIFAPMKIGIRSIRKWGIVYLLGGTLVACDLIDYHPYDGRVDGDIPTLINERQIPLIESRCKGKDTIRFAWVGDTQRAYDELQMFAEAINRRGDIDFVIHGMPVVRRRVELLPEPLGDRFAFRFCTETGKTSCTNDLYLEAELLSVVRVNR